jgi:hypothetical protein
MGNFTAPCTVTKTTYTGFLSSSLVDYSLASPNPLSTNRNCGSITWYKSGGLPPGEYATALAQWVVDKNNWYTNEYLPRRYADNAARDARRDADDAYSTYHAEKTHWEERSDLHRLACNQQGVSPAWNGGMCYAVGVGPGSSWSEVVDVNTSASRDDWEDASEEATRLEQRAAAWSPLPDAPVAPVLADSTTVVSYLTQTPKGSPNSSDLGQGLGGKTGTEEIEGSSPGAGSWQSPPTYGPLICRPPKPSECPPPDNWDGGTSTDGVTQVDESCSDSVEMEVENDFTTSPEEVPGGYEMDGDKLAQLYVNGVVLDMATLTYNSNWKSTYSTNTTTASSSATWCFY